MQEYFNKAKAPLLINSCETDPMFPQEAQKIADEMFSGKFAPGYERTYWDGCTHGFAVRGDLVRLIRNTIIPHPDIAGTPIYRATPRSRLERRGPSRRL